MSAGQIARVLAEHFWNEHRQECACGFPDDTDDTSLFPAHQAAVLAPMLVAAQAEAWDAGYEAGTGYDDDEISSSSSNPPPTTVHALRAEFGVMSA